MSSDIRTLNLELQKKLLNINYSALQQLFEDENIHDQVCVFNEKILNDNFILTKLLPEITKIRHDLKIK